MIRRIALLKAEEEIEKAKVVDELSETPECSKHVIKEESRLKGVRETGSLNFKPDSGQLGKNFSGSDGDPLNQLVVDQ